MNNVATAGDETSSSSSSSMMMTQAFKKVKKEDTSSDSDSDSDNSFYDDWGQGNWCWERDYNKYPVVSFPNSHCHDDSNNNDIDIEDDERKPAAIKSSSSVDSDRVAAASSEMDMTKTKRETQQISIRRNSQIKVEKNEENTNDDINSSVNNSNNKNNNDDDSDVNDDSSFYDDWVEGNWCLLNNYDNNNNNNISNSNSNSNSNNGKGEVEDNNSNHEIRHEMTTRSRKKIRVKNKTNDDSTERKSKRFRFHKDDDHDDEEDSCNKDEEYEENNDDEEEQDSNDVQNHHEDNRPARKRSRPLQIQDDKIWMGMFERLVEYKKQHKNTLVPSRYNHDPKLGEWVNTQRKNYKNNKLLPNRIDLLNSIGFEWEGIKSRTNQIKWMIMFQKLVEYEKQHKNTMVPIKYKNDPKLGIWIRTQRKAYKKDELNPNRVDLLNSVGFKWMGAMGATIDNEKWMNTFQKLVEYKKQHKNTRVPKQYVEDPKLYRWIGTQRQAYKNDELLPKRLTLLNSIGFVWYGSKERNSTTMDG